MTVAKNVAFGLEIRKRPKDEIAHRVDELLKLVHLSQFSHRMPSQLSGGQRQRMALARALAVEPSVLLLDEPFGALDAKVRKELREWLRRLHDEVPVTTVFVTHDQEEALEVADEIVVINEGRVEQVGTPDQLYDEPANDFVMRFLGEVTELGGVVLRPHDIEVARTPQLAGAVEGTVSRVLRVGFEVRLTVLTVDGEEVSVVMTRTHARSLDIKDGDTVWLTPADGAAVVPRMAAACAEHPGGGPRPPLDATIFRSWTPRPRRSSGRRSRPSTPRPPRSPSPSSCGTCPCRAPSPASSCRSSRRSVTAGRRAPSRSPTSTSSATCCAAS